MMAYLEAAAAADGDDLSIIVTILYVEWDWRENIYFKCV
jgi:hypothetical protein